MWTGFRRVGFFGKVFLFLVCLALFAIEPSQAMKIMPGMEQAGTIKMDRSVLRGPDRLAMGAGTLYVVDGIKNNILKFDGRGHYLGDIPFMQVSAVGAAPDGALYIGSHKDYSVAIYKGGKIAGYLGAGEKEFSSVRDIAVCKETGDIYVADNRANVVKIYDAAGKRIGAIEGLNLPIGIAVMNKEVYVVDAPETTDETGRKTTGTQVSVYDLSGSKQRSFRETLVNNEGMFRPSGITVDNNGIIYISDALQNAVFAYDKTGKLIGSISGGTNEIKGAAALTLSDGVLYLASNEKSEIHMFTLAGAMTAETQKQDEAKTQDPPPTIIKINGPLTTPDPDPKTVIEIESSIVVTADSGSNNTVKIFGSDGKAEHEFVPFGKYVGGLDNAVADVNGDGTNEILVSSSEGGSMVGIFSGAGDLLYRFRAFADRSGVLVRAADLDGDGSAEIIVAKNGGPEVRVFSYAGSEVADTGIDLSATHIAAGDIDGDGSPELVTLNGQVIQIYKIDTKGSIGSWKAEAYNEIRLTEETNEITDLTVADMSGDGVQKIVLARDNGDITIISRDGSRADRQLSSLAITAIGQLSEGRGNVVTGLSDGTVHILGPDGVEIRGFSSFITDAGVRLSSGILGN